MFVACRLFMFHLSDAIELVVVMLSMIHVDMAMLMLLVLFSSECCCSPNSCADVFFFLMPFAIETQFLWYALAHFGVS